MSFQWTVVATFLYCEVFLCVLLCLPFISSKRWQSFFKSRLCGIFVSYGNLYYTILIAILVLLFMDALREVRKYGLPDAKQVDLKNNPNAQDHVLMLLFRAQRNLYISGFALFLGGVLGRLIKLLSTTAQLEANNHALQKQAKSATEAAQAILDRNAAEDSKDTDDSEEVESLKKEILQLKQAVKESSRDKQSAQNDLNAMKSQSESLTKEYDRLLKEHTKLQEVTESGDKKDD